MFSLSLFFVLKPEEATEMNHSIDLPAMLKAHFLLNTPYMSSLFITVIVKHALYSAPSVSWGVPS